MIVIALGLLYPGVTLPVLTLTGTIEKSAVAELGIGMLAGESADSQTRQMLTAISSFMGLDQIEGQLQVYSTTRSIWGTARELGRTGNMLVATLIVLFSVVIPTFKLLLQLVALVVPQASLRGSLLWINAVLSKWSMADVFVMGLLVAYMAGSASEQMGEMLTMDARLEQGFYFFLAYCLFSVAISGFLREPESEPRVRVALTRAP
jgi:hypothetical protein